MSNFQQTHVIMQEDLWISIGLHEDAKLKKRHVIFDKGILSGQGSPSQEVCRLTFHSSKLKLSKSKPPHEIILDKENFYGLLKNVHIGRNMRLSLSLTVVTKSMSVTMIVKTDTNTDKYDQWANCLEQNLHFGGYWPVEHVRDVQEECNDQVILSVTNDKLVVLRRLSKNFTGDDQYNVELVRDKQQLVCWNLTSSNTVDGGRDANITVTNTELNDGLQNLVFEVRQNQHVAEDIVSSLTTIGVPHYDIPKLPRKPPTWKQRTDISPHTSHTYENDVNEYWSIVYTLRDVLRHIKSEPDTLRLPLKIRQKLCIMLLEEDLPSWKDLAGKIGLTQDGVNQIQILCESCMRSLNKHTSASDVVTPTECVLRHWQFSHNQPVRDRSIPPCNVETLTTILEEMGRYDLAEMISTDLKSL